MKSRGHAPRTVESIAPGGVQSALARRSEPQIRRCASENCWCSDAHRLAFVSDYYDLESGTGVSFHSVVAPPVSEIRDDEREYGVLCAARSVTWCGDAGGVVRLSEDRMCPAARVWPKVQASGRFDVKGGYHGTSGRRTAIAAPSPHT